MHVHYRNVNDAFTGLVDLFSNGCRAPGLGVVEQRPSRYGDTLTISEPVLITYSHPRERVLLNAARDVNPFALLYESLWMLAGRNNVAPLAYYTKRFIEFSDDGETLNDAYGHRWRHAGRNPLLTDIDQLDVIVQHLKAKPESRRAVLQMWTVEDDLLKVGGGPCTACYHGYVTPDIKCQRCGGTGQDSGSKAVCCNTEVMFSIRQKDHGHEDWDPDLKYSYLDMTVINRSNDLILGMLGADYVCFSFLHEYMAARIGVGVGLYHHFTNNLHVYTANFKPEEWLADQSHVEDRQQWYNYYSYVDVKSVPLVSDPKQFELELPSFVGNAYGSGTRETVGRRDWQEPFLRKVAAPMACAFEAHKDRDYERAFQFISTVAADDWRIAATSWVQRRRAKYERAGASDGGGK